jgi:5-deoxy-glucuronate isomerase
MEERVFGYPEFDEHGEKILTTYTNAYHAMRMDIRVYRMKPGSVRTLEKEAEEMAILLLKGRLCFEWENHKQEVRRQSVFTQGPWCLHVSKGTPVKIRVLDEETEILVQCALNERSFTSRLYSPEDAPWKYPASSKGKFGNVANRRVNTIFDHTIQPESNMVLGEVLNDPGNWSGYLPHQHPHPETYYFLFDHPEGFGASFVGNQVFKSVDGSFAAIPGGKVHPQAVAPGFQMYTCWMIRHLEDRPWLQTDRCEDPKYLWLYEQ